MINDESERKESFLNFLNNLIYESVRPFYRPVKGFPVDEDLLIKNAFYGTILFHAVRKTPLPLDEFAEAKKEDLSSSLAEKIYQDWSAKDSKYAVESYCNMMNFFIDQSAACKTKGNYYLVPDLTVYRREIATNLMCPNPRSNRL